jgi:hypothetical protein
MAAGIVAIIIGTGLLYWNEGDYVYTGDSINEAQSLVVEIPDITKIDPSFTGKLIHATGMTETKDTLTDGIFGIQTIAVKMQRKSEYYQWVESSKTETKKKLGGGEEKVITYTYKQEWVTSPVNSSEFKDPAYKNMNSVLTTVPEETIAAPTVTFGAYTLPPFLKNSISGNIPLNVQLTESKIAELSKHINPQAAQPVNPRQDDMPGFGRVADDPKPRAGVHIQGNTIYLGISPATPQNGDVRVNFTEVKPAQISIVAKVTGSTFEQYRASNNKTFSAFSMGTVGVENLFASAHSSNSTMTWVLRVVGVILVIAGLKMIVAPLAVFASVIPLLGSIVGAGTGIVCTLLGLAWSFLVISIAWLRFRPLIGGALVAVALALIAVLYMKGRKRKAVEAS